MMYNSINRIENDLIKTSCTFAHESAFGTRKRISVSSKSVRYYLNLICITEIIAYDNIIFNLIRIHDELFFKLFVIDLSTN